MPISAWDGVVIGGPLRVVELRLVGPRSGTGDCAYLRSWAVSRLCVYSTFRITPSAAVFRQNSAVLMDLRTLDLENNRMLAGEYTCWSWARLSSLRALGSRLTTASRGRIPTELGRLSNRTDNAESRQRNHVHRQHSARSLGRLTNLLGPVPLPQRPQRQ